MGYIHVESLTGVMQLSASNDLWLYLAITAPLMLVTILGWWLWEVKARRTAAIHEDVEKLKDV
jgi:hypothetical protein